MGVDFTLDHAMAKALIGAGTMIPRGAPVLLSLADKDKEEALPMIRSLAKAGHPLLATEGTARMIEGLGLSVQQITKRLSEGHPNVLDAIEGGLVGAVINTVSGRRGPLKDGFQIRRAAVERRIPCFTSIDTAKIAVEVVTRSGEPLAARPLAEYVAGRPAPEQPVTQGIS
jgi:carbamoyl-phosphate synthase large subunit